MRSTIPSLLSFALVVLLAASSSSCFAIALWLDPYDEWPVEVPQRFMLVGTWYRMREFLREERRWPHSSVELWKGYQGRSTTIWVAVGTQLSFAEPVVGRYGKYMILAHPGADERLGTDDDEWEVWWLVDHDGHDELPLKRPGRDRRVRDEDERIRVRDEWLAAGGPGPFGGAMSLTTEGSDNADEANAANSIYAIHPYRYEERWVFDDGPAGLIREPFVSGADKIIDRMVEHIPEASKGFTLLFSDRSFPDYQAEFDWRRADDGGNWYYSTALDMEGWLYSALFTYFEDAPPKLYVQCKARPDR